MFASGGVNHGIQQVRSDAVAVHHRCAVNHHVHALGCQGVKAGVTDGGGDDGFAGQFFQSEFIKRVRRCHHHAGFLHGFAQQKPGLFFHRTCQANG